MQTESVLQTKNQSEPAKNRFSVALLCSHMINQNVKLRHTKNSVFFMTHNFFSLNLTALLNFVKKMQNSDTKYRYCILILILFD